MLLMIKVKYLIMLTLLVSTNIRDIFIQQLITLMKKMIRRIRGKRLVGAPDTTLWHVLMKMILTNMKVATIGVDLKSVLTRFRSGVISLLQ